MRAPIDARSAFVSRFATAIPEDAASSTVPSSGVSAKLASVLSERKAATPIEGRGGKAVMRVDRGPGFERVR